MKKDGLENSLSLSLCARLVVVQRRFLLISTTDVL